MTLQWWEIVIIPTTIQNAINVYMAALIKSKDGTKEDTANKNATRRALENLLNSLGGHVNQVSATSAEANKMGIYNFSDPVEKFVP